MKISIAIPTWECHGRGSEFLNDLLRTIEKQSFDEFEVCISDHSKDDLLINVYCKFKDRLDIKYSKNIYDFGNGPANTNRAISMCSSDIIKVIFQDDFFFDDESLGKIYTELSISDRVWLLNGCNHTRDDGFSFYNEMYPRWNDKIINGVNTISSPSVLSFRREVFDRVKFDSKLTMMMDCEFYYHTRSIFGDPVYCDDVLTTNRVHSNQISQIHYNSESHYQNMNDEISYCREKHQRK